MRDHYLATRKWEKTKLVQSTGSSISGLCSEALLKPVKEVQDANIYAGGWHKKWWDNCRDFSLSVKYDSTINIVEQYQMSPSGRYRGLAKERRSYHVIF